MSSFQTTIYNAHIYKGTVVGVAPNQTYKDDERQAALVSHINSHRPDIVGLSEVWASSHEDEVISGTKGAGYEGYAYQTSGAKPRLNPGLVTLSHGQLQKPMGFNPYQSLTGWDKHAEKGVIHGQAIVDKKSVHIIQTHTQASYAGEGAQDEKVRKKEIFNTLFPVLDTILQNTTNPVLLLGDLNIVAGSAEYHMFARQMKGRNMRDAWEAVHPGDPGYTYDPAQNALIKRFAPKDKTAQRLDYIFYRDNGLIKPKAAKVLKWKTNTGLDVSDHYGLNVTFDA